MMKRMENYGTWNGIQEAVSSILSSSTTNFKGLR